MKVAYGFTIKCIKKDYIVSCRETTNVMLEMIDRFKAELEYYVFETDSKNRIHMHGTFLTRKGIKRNLYYKRFWTIHIDWLRTDKDYQIWVDYIGKDVKLEKINNYAFIVHENNPELNVNFEK